MRGRCGLGRGKESRLGAGFRDAGSCGDVTTQIGEESPSKLYSTLSLSTQTPVPRKPISVNRGRFNPAYRGLKYFLHLDSVPESPINTKQGKNVG